MKEVVRGKLMEEKLEIGERDQGEKDRQKRESKRVREREGGK